VFITEDLNEKHTTIYNQYVITSVLLTLLKCHAARLGWVWLIKNLQNKGCGDGVQRSESELIKIRKCLTGAAINLNHYLIRKSLGNLLQSLKIESLILLKC
jgi:hypothetical protein